MRRFSLWHSVWYLAVLLLLLGLWFGGGGAEAAAQSRGAIEGVVTTPDGDPLPGAQVVDPALQRGTTTGPDGRFRLDKLPLGNHTIEIRYVGYQTAIRSVDLEAGETEEVNVILKSRVLQGEGVTVTGTARARSTLRAPQDVDVLSAEDLTVNRNAALGDVLRENVDGVSSIQTGSQAGKPVLRGLSGNRVVLLKDGIAQEYYQFGVRHFPTTNASEAERVEVVRGASSILYGSDALGGAINVITKAAPTSPTGELETGGTVSGQLHTNNTERAGSVDLSVAQGNVGWRVGAERRVADNFHTPDAPVFSETRSGGTFGDPRYVGEVPFTNFEQWSAYAQAGMQGDFGSIQVYGDYWGNAHNFLLPAGGQPGETPFPADGLGQNLEHSNVLVKGNLVADGFVLKPRLSWQRSIRQSAPPDDVTLATIRDNGGLGGFDYPLDLKTDIYTARLEAAHPEIGALSGTIGAEVQHQDADTRGPAELQPSARTWNTGLFFFEDIDLDPLTLSFGARLDVRTVEAVPNERTTDADALENTYTTLSGSAGASYAFGSGIALATNVSTGFRAPSVFELYASGVHGGVAAFQRGTPSLDPERSYSGDLSLRVRRDRLTAELTGYVNLIRNYVYLANTGETADSGRPIYEASQTDAAIPGVEASVEVSALPWLQVGGSAALLDGQGDGLGADGGEGQLPLVPANTLDGFVRWVPSGTGILSNPSVEVEVKHAFQKDAAGRFEPFSQFDGAFGPPFGTASTEAYTLVNLEAGSSFELGLGAPLRFSVEVRNVLDETYRDFLDTYKGYTLSPGRDVRLSLSATF